MIFVPQVLSQRLEDESERREKAERAASQLVEHVRSLQTQLEKSVRERESAVVRASKLDGELKTERERGVAREEERERVQESLEAAQKELERVRERVAKSDSELREKKEEARRRDIEHKTEMTEMVGSIWNCILHCLCLCVCVCVWVFGVYCVTAGACESSRNGFVRSPEGGRNPATVTS